MIQVINQSKNQALIDKLFSRSQFDFSRVNEDVQAIIENVKNNKDQAVKAYTKKFDQAVIETFRVSDTLIESALNLIDKTLYEDLKNAAKNIERFHEAQKQESYTLTLEGNAKVSQRIKPIETVGIYVPGGKAAYPSTVLMNAIPAKIAGVKKIVMITPPSSEGTIKDAILVAANIAGVDEIYTVGGAQGIAALTFGTETIPKVDKIVGPGNIYVAIAKKIVSGYVGIDMIAGPSEIVIIADETANPDYIAADLMSQAEHDELASAILLTPSETLAKKVKQSLEAQILTLERQVIIREALRDYGAIVITNTIEEAINITNKIAPEHLEILTENPNLIVDHIENAGAIFLGPYTPEPVGDYFAGPNHTLPTSTTSRFSSALSTSDFYKKTSIIQYTKAAFDNAKESIIRLANEEGLTAHALSIKVRK